MGPATIENTKVSIDVAGEPFAAAGDVVDVHGVNLEAKQTEPPARYSQGKLVQEMEKRGLGPSSTRSRSSRPVSPRRK